MINLSFYHYPGTVKNVGFTCSTLHEYLHKMPTSHLNKYFQLHIMLPCSKWIFP